MDRRVRKTRQQLRKCLTELMVHKSINEITVRELSEMADINRGTFYLHYKDVYDMLEQIENEMMDEFKKVINHYSVDEIEKSPDKLFADVFKFVYENADMCGILLSENGDEAFVNKISETLKTKAMHDWIEIYSASDKERNEYYYAYLLAGCIGVIKRWTAEGMKISPDEMAHMVADMVLKGVKVLVK